MILKVAQLYLSTLKNRGLSGFLMFIINNFMWAMVGGGFLLDSREGFLT